MLDKVVVEKFDVKYKVELVNNDDDLLILMNNWLVKVVTAFVMLLKVVVERRVLDRRKTYNLAMVVVVQSM